MKDFLVDTTVRRLPILGLGLIPRLIQATESPTVAVTSIAQDLALNQSIFTPNMTVVNSTARPSLVS